MTNVMIQDLLRSKPREVYMLFEEWKLNAGYCGYVFTDENANKLEKARALPEKERFGIMALIWHNLSSPVSTHSMLKLLSAPKTFSTKIHQYKRDKYIQSVTIDRPPVYFIDATPHVSMSWKKSVNPVAGGSGPFVSLPNGCPIELTNGKLKFVLKNSREMSLKNFNHMLCVLTAQRIKEIEQEIPEKAAAFLSTVAKEIPLKEILWDELDKQMQIAGFSIPIETMQLYIEYNQVMNKIQM